MASREIDIKEGNSEEEDEQYTGMDYTEGFSRVQNEEVEEYKVQNSFKLQDTGQFSRQQQKRQEEQFTTQNEDRLYTTNENTTQNKGQKSQNKEQKQTFVTQEEKTLYTVNELLFAGGKFAKLIKIQDPYDSRLNINEILTKTQIQTFCPIILLSGADGSQHAKVLQGLVRTASYTDAVIIDSGLKSGIENLCYSKKVKLIGVCPESSIVYPTKDSTGERLSELTPGHSHFMVLQKGNAWGSEAKFKHMLIQKITKRNYGGQQCKCILVLVLDRIQVEEEVKLAVENDWPILLLSRSPLAKQLEQALLGNIPSPEEWRPMLEQGRWFVLDKDCTAEELAVTCHLHLTVRI